MIFELFNPFSTKRTVEFDNLIDGDILSHNGSPVKIRNFTGYLCSTGREVDERHMKPFTPAEYWKIRELNRYLPEDSLVYRKTNRPRHSLPFYQLYKNDTIELFDKLRDSEERPSPIEGYMSFFDIYEYTGMTFIQKNEPYLYKPNVINAVNDLLERLSNIKGILDVKPVKAVYDDWDFGDRYMGKSDKRALSLCTEKILSYLREEPWIGIILAKQF